MFITGICLKTKKYFEIFEKEIVGENEFWKLISQKSHTITHKESFTVNVCVPTKLLGLARGSKEGSKYSVRIVVF